MTADRGPLDAVDLFDPMNPEVLRNPYAAYRVLRDHRPVAYLRPLDCWVVSRHADVRAVLSAPEAFSAARAFAKHAKLTDARAPGKQIALGFAGDLGGVVSSTDGDAHRRLRRMVARMLSKPRIDVVDETVRVQVSGILMRLKAAEGEFDVVADLARPLAARTIGEVMGLDETLTKTLVSWTDTTWRALDPADPYSDADAAPAVVRANLGCVRAVAAFLRAEARSPARPSAGLAGAWRDADGPAAREELVLSVLQLFQAGFETIVSAVASVLATFVVDRPGWDSALPRRLAPAVDEGLRLASPVRATLRTAAGDRDVGGVCVPGGARVMVLIGSANRDERVFRAASQARLGRGPHLAFGAGAHRCLGRYLAHLELAHVLDELGRSARQVTSCGQPRVSANVLKAGYACLPVRARWR